MCYEIAYILGKIGSKIMIPRRAKDGSIYWSPASSPNQSRRSSSKATPSKSQQHSPERQQNEKPASPKNDSASSGKPLQEVQQDEKAVSPSRPAQQDQNPASPAAETEQENQPTPSIMSQTSPPPYQPSILSSRTYEFAPEPEPRSDPPEFLNFGFKTDSDSRTEGRSPSTTTSPVMIRPASTMSSASAGPSAPSPKPPEFFCLFQGCRYATDRKGDLETHVKFAHNLAQNQRKRKRPKNAHPDS